MRVETKSELVVDRSRHGELLRINFNMSFPQLSCEFATLDVSDALGTVRITKLIGQKLSEDRCYIVRLCVHWYSEAPQTSNALEV